MLASETPQNMSPQRKLEVLEWALDHVVKLTNGATFSGGKVAVMRANDVATSFEWRGDEILKFLKLKDAEKETFRAPAMGSIPDPADLYRKVYRPEPKSKPRRNFFEKNNALFKSRGHGGDLGFSRLLPRVFLKLKINEFSGNPIDFGTQVPPHDGLRRRPGLLFDGPHVCVAGARRTQRRPRVARTDGDARRP